MLHRNAVRSLIAALSLAAAAALPAAAADKVKIALASPSFVYTPVLVATAAGYLAAEGIEHEIVYTGSGAKSVAAIVGGDLHVLNGSPTSMLRARMQGAPLIIVGASMTQYGSQVIASAGWAAKHGLTPASGYADRLKLLKGARIAITSAGSATDIQIRYLASEAKLDPDKDMTLQGMTQPVMLAQMQQERIDMAVLASPNVEAAMRQFKAAMVFNTAKGEIPALNGIFYNSIIVKESWGRENPAVVVRFLRAVQKSLDAIHDPAITLATRDKVHATHVSKMDKAAFDDAWENNRGAYPKSILIDKAMIERVGTFMATMEKAPVDAAVLPTAWTDVYAKEALKSLGR